MTPTHSPTEIGRLWFEKIWNQRDRELIHELMAPDAIGYLEGGQTIVGPEAFLEFQGSFLAIIPDLQIEILHMIGDPGAVCIHWQAVGCHTGEGMGCLPTGNTVSFQGVTWLTIEGGKVTGGRDFWNIGGLMQTLAAGTPATH